MFVWSLRASTIKLVGIIILSVAAIALFIGIVPNLAEKNEKVPIETIMQGKKVEFSGIKNDSDIIGFINQFGINVEETPLEVEEVKIPNQFDAVLQKYNIVQNLQGFDLVKYKNKTVTRHTYKIKNEADENLSGKDGSLLTIIIYRDKVIGGDITSYENGGTVSGFVDYKKA